MAIIEGTFEKSSSLKVAIVIARFNDLITNRILSGCLDCLNRHGLDISEYAIENAFEDMKPYVNVGNVKKLKFEENAHPFHALRYFLVVR